MMNLKNLMLLLATMATVSSGLKEEQIREEKARTKHIGKRKFGVQVVPKDRPHTVLVTSVRVDKEAKEAVGIRLAGSFKAGPHFRASRLVKAKDESGAAKAKEAVTIAYGLIGLVEYEDNDESGSFNVDADDVHRVVRLVRGDNDAEYERSYEDLGDGVHSFEGERCNEAGECIGMQMIVATEPKEITARNQTRVIAVPTGVETVVSLSNLQYATETSRLSALAFIASNKLTSDEGEDEVEVTSGDEGDVEGVETIEIEKDEEGGGRFRFADTVTCVDADGNESEGTVTRQRLTKEDLPGKIDEKQAKNGPRGGPRNQPIKDRYDAYAANNDDVDVESQRKLFFLDFDCGDVQPVNIVWDPSVEVDDEPTSVASSAAILSSALIAAAAFVRL